MEGFERMPRATAGDSLRASQGSPCNLHGPTLIARREDETFSPVAKMLEPPQESAAMRRRMNVSKGGLKRRVATADFRIRHFVLRLPHEPRIARDRVRWPDVTSASPP